GVRRTDSVGFAIGPGVACEALDQALHIRIRARLARATLELLQARQLRPQRCSEAPAERLVRGRIGFDKRRIDLAALRGRACLCGTALELRIGKPSAMSGAQLRDASAGARLRHQPYAQIHRLL